jgi:glyceraldehyde 3-phosphate dehydrogenase
MTINVAINGFGRIGRMVFRAGWNDKRINFVAINDLTDNKTLAHLLKYDSVHGIFPEPIGFTKDSLVIGKKKIKVFQEKDPTKIPWHELKIKVVVESTGRFRKPQDAAQHLTAGAKKVIISAPCKCETKVCPSDTTTIVLGVNEKTYKKKEHHIISNASCTTNCVAPILKVIDDKLGISYCNFTTIHAYTADQHLVDGPHKDLRRARAAAINLVPTTTGADLATAEVIPSLKGKIKGMAIRVPIPNGSITEFSIRTKTNSTTEEVNQIMKNASKGKMKHLIEYSERELVSNDIIGNSHSSIFDSKLTHCQGNNLKIVAWYDNEWGYSCRMIDLIKKVI